MHDSTPCPASKDNFRDVFKYYKRKQPPPDLAEVLDIDSLEESRCTIESSNMTEGDVSAAEEVGLFPQSSWRIYSLHQHPGLLVIRNPFTSHGQLRWMERCLKDYPCAGNPSNLASHGIKLSGQTWWELCHTSEGKRSGLDRKLRWVTLGYHHNWDTKEYSERMRGEMPRALVQLCTVVAKALGFLHFTAQAAIVNYYHLDSTLAAHTDHSEPCFTAPLFSFSFGQSAVFLIGGSSKATRPTAMYLHSGDVLVMSGPSRLSYHAVPRVVEVRHQPWAQGGNQAHGGNQAQGGNQTHGGNQTQGGNQAEGRNQAEGGNQGEGGNRTESVKQKETIKTEDKFDDKANKCDKSHQTNKMPERETNEATASSSCSSFIPWSHSTSSESGMEHVTNKKVADEDVLEYVKFSRINMNVRQVLEPSMDRLS